MLSPEFSGIILCDPEAVTYISPLRKYCFHFGQHMAEDQTQFCQASSIRRVFVVHFLFSVLEKLDCQLGLLEKVLYVYPKILAVVQNVHSILVLRNNQLQMLVSVGQNVQDVWRTVLEAEPLVLTVLYHLVHQLPCFLDSFLVDLQSRSYTMS